jgi:hypothetical protein
MPLLPATHEILKRTEELTGRPVYVTEDPSLSILATMQTARGTAPMHTIRYRPTSNAMSDYFICWQCGFLIRLFSNPPSERLEFAGAPDADQRVKALYAHGGASEPDEAIAQFLATNILTQLRSYPIGLRIDDWLFAEFPELRQAQIHGARVQLQDNLAALNSPGRAMSPELIVSANTAMNAAFAAYWARSLADESLMLPYQSIGALKAGSRLMEIFHYCDTSPTADRPLVDLWAHELGLAGWYEWKQYTLE